MIRKIFCVALISLGASLDAYFCVFRFRADGTIFPAALAMALALELLLAFSVWRARGSKIAAVLAVALTLYMVVQTSAGQTFSLLVRDADAGDTTATVKALMAEEQNNLDRLDTEYRTINKQLSSIVTVEDRSAYGLTIGRMTARLGDIEKSRTAAAARLSILADKAGEKEISRVKGMSIYDFYASMPKWGGMDWLKFVFHTILSIFIAVMTPIGILTWNSTATKEPKIKAVESAKGFLIARAWRSMVKQAKAENEDPQDFDEGVTAADIDIFVTRAYKKIATGSGDKIISEYDFNSWCERDKIAVAPGTYAEGVRRARSLGIINRDGVALIKDISLIRQKLQKAG